MEEFYTKNVASTAAGFLCLLCNKFVKLKQSIKRHLRDAHLDSGISFSCPICQNVYKSRNTFSQHIYTVHPELKGIDFAHCEVNK